MEPRYKRNPFFEVRAELNALAGQNGRPAPFPDNPEFVPDDGRGSDSQNRRGRPSLFQPGWKIPETMLTVESVRYPEAGVSLDRAIVLRCECGKLCEYRYREMYPWPRYSCGCTPRPRRISPDRDLAGREFGRLTVLRSDTGLGWLCLCSECGSTHYHRAVELSRAGESSCPDCGPRTCWEFEILFRHRGITRTISVPVYHEPTVESALKALKTGLVIRIKGNSEEISCN